MNVSLFKFCASAVIVVVASLSRLAAPAPAQTSGELPPSPGLLRSLEAFDQDLLLLDGALQGSVQDSEAAAPADLHQSALQAPAPEERPSLEDTSGSRERLSLSLAEAVAVAVANNPELAEQRARIDQRQSVVRAVEGRFWPRLGLSLGGAFSQASTYNKVLEGNLGIYPPDSPFLVETGGWNRIQANLGMAWAGLDLGWELISFERGAALAEEDQQLKAVKQSYDNGLRALQLAVSEAYYGQQLAGQLLRIRAAVVRNDALLLQQVQALKRSGLVPRLDLLRAQASLQQSRFRLEQAKALQRSRQQALTSLLNVPFTTELSAVVQVKLQPAWPLDLERTVVGGLTDNPALEALASERQALLNQGDRRQARLLPRLELFALGGGATEQLTKPVIDLQGCCKEMNTPQMASQRADWIAGLRLHWRFFDAGTASAEASASRAAAQAVLQRLAAERNRIRQSLETAFFDYRASLSQLAAAEASYAAAREAFRDARARYELGLANYTDVSNTISLLTASMEGIAESMTLSNISYARMLRQLQSGPVAGIPGAITPELTLQIGSDDASVPPLSGR
ncbi:MAG: TolC family protein [Synechococcus sp. BS307-5m-G39]|nr:TolC family protein [Synechococcus sp. BS307-5m-G39]MBL6801413.1 TolC family protein [Synechococcus sp. BS307-5m-G37]